jgi:hypothetical protein
MKNVMVYNIIGDKIRSENGNIITLLKAQIDNSLSFGWAIEDIIIGTNFDFEYKGIKSHLLSDICSFNIFNNKWYGMLELVNKGILNDNFWFHDTDNWQINSFDFPEFNGQIAACTYIHTPEWNTGSVFVKQSAKYILEYIVESMKMNPLDYFGDEHWIAFLRKNSEIAEYLDTVNTEYCVGYTFLEKRLHAANKPVKVIAFKPYTESHNAFLNNKLLHPNLVNILDNIYKN